MEDRANRNERNPLPFWLPARSNAFILYFLFFFSPLYYCLPYWPRAREANRAAKASCGRFNIISLTEMSDLFCMWGMMKCDSLLPHRHEKTLSVGCLYWAKVLLTISPRTLLTVPRGLLLILSQILSLNIFPFFINCSFWFWENHQAHAIESFSLLLATLCHPTHSCLSPFCTLFQQNCASRQKGQHYF